MIGLTLVIFINNLILDQDIHFWYVNVVRNVMHHNDHLYGLSYSPQEGNVEYNPPPRYLVSTICGASCPPSPEIVVDILFWIGQWWCWW